MKKVLIALAVVVVLLGGAAFWAYHSIDFVVKVVLEYYGPQVLGVSVDVKDVSISPKDGRGSLRGVEIGNAAGFSAPRAARFGEIRVALDPATVTGPVVVIRELTVLAPVVVYERGAKSTNLEAIQKRIDAYVKSSVPAADKGAARPRPAARRFIVERLTIRSARVTMTNPALRGQGIEFDIPDIHLRDVGRRQNGLRASEIANLVATTLIERIGRKVLTNIDLLRRGGVEGAVDALRGLLR